LIIHYTPNALAGNRLRVQQLGASFKSNYRVEVLDTLGKSVHGPGKCAVEDLQPQVDFPGIDGKRRRDAEYAEAA
jgi:hypothetical protein